MTGEIELHLTPTELPFKEASYITQLLAHSNGSMPLPISTSKGLAWRTSLSKKGFHQVTIQGHYIVFFSKGNLDVFGKIRPPISTTKPAANCT